MVVRRVGDGLVGEAGIPRAAAVDHQVAIADTRKELDIGPAQRGVQGLHQRPALLAGDVPRGEIGEPAVLDGHQITADGPVFGPQHHVHGGRLERSPSGVVILGVIAEEAQGGHVAGRQEPVGHVPRAAHNPLAR